VNNVTNARVQITVDAENSKMVHFLASLPKNSKVFVNIQGNYAGQSEYVFEIGLHLFELYKRPDILVDEYHYDLADGLEREKEYFVVTPKITNQLVPSVRMAVNESGASHWSQAFVDFLGVKKERTYASESSVRLLDLRIQKPLSLVYGSGVLGPQFFGNGAIVDTRKFSFGWDVYRVQSVYDSVARPAIYHKQGMWEFLMPNGSTKQLRFGQQGDIPVVGDVNGDGYTEIGLYRPSNRHWYIDINYDGRPEIEFEYIGMQSGDLPLLGDWNGDGIWTPGYFRPEIASWHFRDELNTGGDDYPAFAAGTRGDVPMVGDWDGKGRFGFGIYRPSTGEVDLSDRICVRPQWVVYGQQTNVMPVVADWGGRSIHTIAFVSGGKWKRKLNNSNFVAAVQPSDIEYPVGDAVPLGGRWRFTK
jgi:hypothetical protein